MTLKEMIKILRVSENSALALCRKGRFRARKNRSGDWYIPSLPFDRPTITPDEIGAILRVSGRFIRNLCNDRRIKSKRIGRQWRIDWLDGITFIKNRGQFNWGTK